jgi:hypothetical protein
MTMESQTLDFTSENNGFGALAIQGAKHNGSGRVLLRHCERNVCHCCHEGENRPANKP